MRRGLWLGALALLALAGCDAAGDSPCVGVGCLVAPELDGGQDARIPDLGPDQGRVDAAGDDAGVDAARDAALDAEVDAAPCVPAEERCNGRDDDCDGRVDEGFEGVGMPCSAGSGGCTRDGVRVCDADGALACSAQPGDPVAETCGDGRDDDCDGTVDEGFDTLGMPCEAGSVPPAGRHPGLRRRPHDLRRPAAGPRRGAVRRPRRRLRWRHRRELPGPGRAVRRGRELCEAAGEPVCLPGGQVRCNAEPGPPMDEICNGLDDTAMRAPTRPSRTWAARAPSAWACLVDGVRLRRGQPRPHPLRRRASPPRPRPATGSTTTATAPSTSGSRAGLRLRGLRPAVGRGPRLHRRRLHHPARAPVAGRRGRSRQRLRVPARRGG
ncbi:MAG: MopE-related protein [bacterium]